MQLLIVCLAGLIWGSFLTTLGLREDPKSVLKGRSKCPNCHKELSLIDLIPIFSFVFLRGHCRQCKQKIPSVHLWIELITVAVAILLYLRFSSVSMLIVAGVKDVKSREVDLWVFVAGIILAVAARFYLNRDIVNLIYAALSAAIVPFLLYFISREKWMGLGDTFFAAWVGILSGFPAAIVAIFSAFLLGSIFGIIKLAVVRNKDNVLPFGPFIAVSSVVGIFWGQSIVEFYLKLIGY
jgi:leader peptidase (prepilin peptidase)/N-methyltransferase